LLIRQGLWQGVGVESSWANHYIGCLDRNLDAPQIIESYSPLTVDGLTHLQVEEMPAELPLQLLAQGASQQSFNLLQGQFKAKEKKSPLERNWLLVAGFAVFALILNMTIKGIELVQLNNQIAAVEADIVQVYKKTFPDSQRVRVTTIRSLINGKLKQIQGNEGAVSFLTMMQQLEPAFSTVPQVKPLSVRFEGDRNTIRLQASANSYQSFDKFKLALEQALLEVVPGSQNAQGNEIVGSFSIRSKS
jgi:general secretion pathway protein L